MARSDNQPPATTCAILQAAQLKANYPSAKLIAIGIGTDTDNAVINKSYNTYLDASYATGTMDLNAIFADISREITDATTAGGQTLTDPMSSFVTLDTTTDIQSNSATPAEGEVTVGTDSNSTIAWDLSKAASTTNTETANGVTTTTKTYTLTYRITVNQNDAFYNAIKASGSVPTNGTTVLPYSINNNGTTTSGTLTFDVPTVTCTLPKHDVTYSWGAEVPASETKPDGITDVEYGTTYTVDTKYTNGYTVNHEDAYGNVDGTWTFSGWNLIGNVVTTAVRRWATADVDTDSAAGHYADVARCQAHSVTYSWGTTPSNVYDSTGTAVSHRRFRLRAVQM
jgi:hypothetical protein